jgi:hypothetical protein
MGTLQGPDIEVTVFKACEERRPSRGADRKYGKMSQPQAACFHNCRKGLLPSNDECRV